MEGRSHKAESDGSHPEPGGQRTLRFLLCARPVSDCVSVSELIRV